MLRLSLHVALAWFLASGIAAAQDAPATDAASQNSIKLARVLADMPAGTPYITVHQGTLFCGGPAVVRNWIGGRSAQTVSAYSPAFRTVLEQAGYKVITPGEDNLFDEDVGAADLEVAAVITDERIQGCMSKGSWLVGTDPGDARGDGSMKVDWQVYSRLKKQVVAHVSTSGTSKLDHPVAGGVQQLVIMAFTENVRQLVQNADFRAAMTAPKAFTAGFQMPGQQAPIALAGSLKAGSRKIADATSSVVTVITSAGSGSGFLVSIDGYFLTDAHVVGDDKTVRIRWPDGLEGLATVERAIKNRDIAIIKANPRDRAPLALRRGPVTPGDRVYVIGSPSGKNFEGTVSSGVISADRTIDGLRYIQSDAAMSPGSSGGPLLDEKGEVIGLSEMLYYNQGKTANLNLFTPIGDAMDFLALQPQ
ncbi:MAG TPA: serine protease [Rhizomicrobium sp.]|jgi:S1-C subfamily serine protease|nr:serine protease [Rhizomicrobium sp.]